MPHGHERYRGFGRHPDCIPNVESCFFAGVVWVLRVGAVVNRNDGERSGLGYIRPVRVQECFEVTVIGVFPSYPSYKESVSILVSSA